MCAPLATIARPLRPAPIFLALFEIASVQTRFFFLTFAKHRYAMAKSKMPAKKTSEIKARVTESMRAELEAIAEKRAESTSVIVREMLRLAMGAYFDPELAANSLKLRRRNQRPLRK
jgi:hypothetical protein